MKRNNGVRLRIPALCLAAALFLAAALCGCGGPADAQNGTEAPASAAGPRLSARDCRAEADGTGLGPVYLLDDREDQRYLALKDLDAAWSLQPSEQDGALKLNTERGPVRLRDGSAEAEAENGGRIALGAPVLHLREDWYLPEGTVQTLFDRIPAFDGRTLRCLRVTEGIGISLNGAALEGGCLWDGAPVLPAGQLAALYDAAEEGERDGRATLTLRAGESVLSFKAGWMKAEQDGTEFELPVPAWKSEGVWYLPVQTCADCLGCLISVDGETGRTELMKPEPGGPYWFAGTGFEQLFRLGETPCGRLTELAEALDGTLEEQTDAVTLKVPEHSLVFRPGEASAELDGKALTLPCPFFPMDGDWLTPLEPLAETLGLTKTEDEEKGPVWSRMRPCETAVLLDGLEAASYTLPEGGLYVLLDDLGRAAGGSLALSTNEASLNVWGREAVLRGGASSASVDGTELTLAFPVSADGSAWYVPTELLPALGLTELQDPELDQIYYTHIVRHEDLKTGYRVPVLMYHAVSDDNIWGIPELFVSPVKLEEQIKAMLDAGYTAITFEDLDRIDEIEKPVMLTFDDGYDDNYTELFPLLKKYNVKATVFMIVNDIGKNHKLTKERIREMSDSGLVSIQSHTLSHGYLDEMYESQLHRENRDSMIALARITGKQPFVMCYPTGRSSGASREITAEYYEYGLCMGGPCWVTGDAPYRIYRYYISRYTSVDTFLSYLAGNG